MRTRRGWLGVCLWVPVLVMAAEPASRAAPPAGRTAPTPSLDLKNASVQQVVRATAAAHDASRTQPAPPAATSSRLPDLQFRAPRRVHHHECNLFDCVAYSADGTALFSFPREQLIHSVGNGPNDDGWLSCQQVDDMLSTFERYDKCRGVSIGLPPKTVGGVDLLLPKIRL